MNESRARIIVRARSGGICEAQVVCRGARAGEWHHRINRSQGGPWCPSNGLDACSPCHTWITHHSEAAEPLGLHLKPGVDPATVPVWSALYGRHVLLDPDGCLTFAEAA